MPRVHNPEQTCQRGHGLTYEFLGGRMRCPECRREDNRKNDAKKRARKKAGLPDPKTCPACVHIPCLCEEL